MADKATRGVGKVMDDLTRPSKTEFCRLTFQEISYISEDAQNSLRDGNLRKAWELVNEAIALDNISQHCPKYKI